MILLVPDSFKETASAKLAASSMEEALQEKYPWRKVCSIPFSDGGEGFTEVLQSTMGGEFISVPTVDAMGRNKLGRVLILPDGTGVLEVAEASGLQDINHELRNPETASSFGTGILLKYLLDKGCPNIWLGLGGSAINDGGAGMLQALGWKFFSNEKEIVDIPRDLENVTRIKSSHYEATLLQTSIVLATDVENVLLGPNGATYTFAPQKGAQIDQLSGLENRMLKWSNCLQSQTGRVVAQLPGSGAAGGIGIPLLSYSKAQLISGFTLLSKHYELVEKIKACDLLITGEGCLDETSFQGKLIGRLYKLCLTNRKRMIVICGKNKLSRIPEGMEIIELQKGISWEETKIKAPEFIKLATLKLTI